LLLSRSLPLHLTCLLIAVANNFAFMYIRTIAHNSNEYDQMIGLRITELLEPIGVAASYIDKEGERSDILMAAFDDKEMIGCCVLTPRGSGVVQLRQMAVRRDYRGKGIGASIVDFAEAVARENGFATLMMHARDPVVGFYEKSGYETYDEPFSEVGVGHHKMRKQLC
jgi:N-acetylglutamate synthase-like GNAT family acetyltransferase